MTYGKETGYLQTGTTARKLQTKSVQGAVIDSSTLNVKKDVSYSYYVYKESDDQVITAVLSALPIFDAKYKKTECYDFSTFVLQCYQL